MNAPVFSAVSLENTTPVSVWLADLRWHAEMECANVLQSKAILPSSSGSPRSESLDSGLCVSVSLRASIEMVEKRASNVTNEFRKVFQSLQRNRLKYVHTNVRHLTGTIRALLRDLAALVKNPSASFMKKEVKIRQLCDKLEEAAAGCETETLFLLQLAGLECHFLVLNGHAPSIEPVCEELSYVAAAFTDLTEQVTMELVEFLVNSVRTRGPHAAMYTALQDLMLLGLKSDVMSKMVAKAGGVGVMVNLCNDVPYKRHWPLTLRALSSVCCNKEAVLQLEKHRGVQVVTSLLCDSFLPELVRSEAAGVIAQITSPWLTQGSGAVNCLTDSLEDLVRALTMLCLEASCHDIFLLAAAAVANITFIAPSAFDFILRFNSVRVLIDACQLNKAESLFAKDQVATVLANMAVYTWCHREITSQNGIELLLHFLSETPTGYSSISEKAACERLQQKSAIALSRLSREAHNAQIVIECAGLERLATLCRRADERHNSDAVLVACLATLRQIHDTVGAEDFSWADLQDLVHPKMIDSFLTCSQMEESFV